MRIVVVACQKGGVAKTTTAVTVAHGLALRGQKVLLVDLDAQGHCATLLRRPRHPGIHELLVARARPQDVMQSTGRTGLWLIPGDNSTATAQSLLAARERNDSATIARALQPLVYSDMDFVVIDTPPTIGPLQHAALFIANDLLIPTVPDYLGLDAVRGTMTTLRSVTTQKSGCHLLGVVPTFYDATRETRTIIDLMAQAFGTHTMLPPVHRAVVLRECAAEGRTIFEYAPASRAAEEYGEVVTRVEQRGTVRSG